MNVLCDMSMFWLASVDVNLEMVRVNLCVAYLMTVARFLTDAFKLPEDANGSKVKAKMARMSSWSPPGGSAQQNVARPAVTVSGRFKKPEIVLFAEPDSAHSRVLVLKVIYHLWLLSRCAGYGSCRHLSILPCQWHIPPWWSMLSGPCQCPSFSAWVFLHGASRPSSFRQLLWYFLFPLFFSHAQTIRPSVSFS